MGRLPICVGVFLLAVSASSAVEARDLRVVTFNTAMARVIGLRGSSGLEALLGAELGRPGPDVLALQEVCLNRSAELELYLRLMQRVRGAYYHYSDYASPHLGQSCDKGQALVSSLPILGAGTLQLPTVGADRSAIWADLSIAGPGFDRVRVYCLHLSNRKGDNYVPVRERAAQLGPVLEHSLEFLRAHPGVPVVVAGDFNTVGHLTDPWVREPAITSMLEYFQASEPSFTPTFVLPYQLDWIFYANLNLARGEVLHALYSDHFPVVADFYF